MSRHLPGGLQLNVLLAWHLTVRSLHSFGWAGRDTLCPADALRQDLISAGVVPALVASLVFADSAVQAATTEAIGLLACDVDARQEFCACEGVASLLPLLRSPDKEVRGRAVWTLSMCAQSKEVAEQACQSG